MKALLRAEFFKLRSVRENMWLAALAIVAFTVAGGLYGALASDPIELTRQDLLKSIGEFSGLVAIPVGVVAALAITSEFRFRVIHQTLTATPQRTRVFVAKAIVTGVFGLTVGLVATVGAVAVGSLFLDGRGGGIGLSADDGTLAAALGVVALAVLLSLCGYGIGLLVRSVPIALAIVVLWPLVIEPVVGGVLSGSGVDDEARFLPYTAATALVTPQLDPGAPGRLYGGVLLGVVTLALVAGGIAFNQRRDV